MLIKLDSQGTIDGFRTLLDELSHNKDVRGLIILACDANGFTPETIDYLLQQIPIPVFGGIFPGIVHRSEKLDKGTIVIGLKNKPDVYTVAGLSDPDMDYDQAIDALIPDSSKAKTMFVFVDGYAQRISNLLESLYNCLRLRLNTIGGGAGSINPSALDMTGTPCLFTNEGLIKDSAVLALTDFECAVAAGHGWHKISGPYKVTESKGNAIISLDWIPAFEKYSEIIRNKTGETLTSADFFDIAKKFPFGISRLGAEIIVRDPFTVEGDSLIVATEIPQESFIDILTGDPDSIVTAAGHSYDRAMSAFDSGDGKGELIFLIDCISRALFLGNEFAREICAVSRDNLPLIGVLSLGEIANSGESYMELYNKTCVIGVLGE